MNEDHNHDTHNNRNQENEIDDSESLFVESELGEAVYTDITKRLKDENLNTLKYGRERSKSHLANTLEERQPPIAESKGLIFFESHPVTFSIALPFQKRILTTLLDHDGLLIIAPGLGYLNICSNLLHALHTAGIDYSGHKNELNSTEEPAQNNIVVVLGLHEMEIPEVQENMRELSIINTSETKRVHTGKLHVLNSGLSSSKRNALYSKGGVFSVTSRVFVVDLLNNTIDPKKISGIVVMNAELVEEMSSVAFILRLYREKNRDGFIKALSESPARFTGFSPLASKMKHLYVNQAFLWPRFHISVRDSMNLEHLKGHGFGQATKSQIDIKSIVEFEVSLTPMMKEIQTALINSMEISLTEIRRTCKGLTDLDDLHFDKALSRDLYLEISKKLQPVWHRVQPQTKAEVNNLKSLRLFLTTLLSYDSITFFKDIQYFYNEILRRSKDGIVISAFLECMDNVLSLSRKRALEDLPKWDQLMKILLEVTVENNLSRSDVETGPILVMCSDRKTAHQLSMIIRTAKKVESGGSMYFSSDVYMKGILQRFQNEFQVNKQLSVINGSNMASRSTSSISGRGSKRRRTRGGSTALYNKQRDLSDSLADAFMPNDDIFSANSKDDQENRQEDEPVYSKGSRSYSVLDNNSLVLIQIYEQSRFDSILSEYQPSCVIMYEPNLPFTRSLEFYRATNYFQPLKVYLLYYKFSVEEQRYLGAMRHEQDLFDKLIRERTQLPALITEDIDDGHSKFVRNALRSSVTGNTRKAGGQLSALWEEELVIVDSREFRAKLPAALYFNNLRTIPRMLTVGDYVLSSNICVERKSMPDLISSFGDGRLYAQCEAMLRYYQNPMLLVEFEETNSFSLLLFETPGPKSSKVEPSMGVKSLKNSKDLQSKLMLLLLQFPRLRVIWSVSSKHSAEIIRELKEIDTSQPDPEKSVKCGIDSSTMVTKADRKYNQTAIDILKLIPGITSSNYHLVVSNVRSLKELCLMEESELAAILGADNAKKALEFLNFSFPK